MASQTQGIQQLLAAEKRAAEKVSEARKRKNRRLKQAKEEAQAEIERFKFSSCSTFLPPRPRAPWLRARTTPLQDLQKSS